MRQFVSCVAGCRLDPGQIVQVSGRTGPRSRLISFHVSGSHLGEGREGDVAPGNDGDERA